MLRTLSNRGCMNPDDERRIQKNYVFIEKEVDAKDIIPFLFTSMLIDIDDRADILSKTTRLEQTQRMLEVLHRRGKDAYEIFLKALDDARYYHVATRLRDTEVGSDLEPSTPETRQEDPEVSLPDMVEGYPPPSPPSPPAQRNTDGMNKRSREIHEAEGTATNVPVPDLVEGYPPPSHPAQRKTELMNKYSGEIHKAEASARNAALDLNNSFDDLVGYLTQNVQSDLLKVRAILCWLSKQNFVLARRKEEQSESTPKGFLNLIACKQKSISQLFATLCRKAGVPCVVLKGYNKGCGQGIRPHSPIINSAWLAVYVEKQWGFVEPMLALKNIKVERPQYLKIETTGKAIHERSSQMSVTGSINEAFFLPDPEDFIYMCRPETDEWQLLPDRPWTWEDFINAPDTKPQQEPDPVQQTPLVPLPIEQLSVPDTEDGYPPPQPPKTRKKDIITEEDIKRIDTKSRQAPKELYKSYKDLFSYLFDSRDSNVKMARALLSWLAANLDCQKAGIPLHEILNVTDPHTPLGVIKLRTVTSSLTVEQYFAVLCRQAELPCMLIRGQKKTHFSYELGDQTTRSREVWNAVYLDGCWRFVDVENFIFGFTECEVRLEHDANGVQEKRKYKHVDKFKDFFFLTDPDEFIHFCFPEDAKWQLLQQPFSGEQFFGEPWIRPPYFHSPFRLRSAGKVRIDAEDGIASVLFEGRATQRHPLRYNLYYAEKNSWDAFPEDLNVVSFITTSVVCPKPPVTSLFFSLPVSGTYILEPLNDSEDTLCKFIVNCFGNTTKNQALPGDPSIGYGYQPAAQDAGLGEPSREEGIIFATEGQEVSFSFRKLLTNGSCLSTAGEKTADNSDLRKCSEQPGTSEAEGKRVTLLFDARLLRSGESGVDDFSTCIPVSEDDTSLVVKAIVPPEIQSINLAVAIIKRDAKRTKIVVNYLVTSDQRYVAAAAGRTRSEQAHKVEEELNAAMEGDDIDRLEAALREFNASRRGKAQVSQQTMAEDKLMTLHQDEFKEAVIRVDVDALERALDSAHTSVISIRLSRTPIVQGAEENLEKLKQLKRTL